MAAAWAAEHAPSLVSVFGAEAELKRERNLVPRRPALLQSLAYNNLYARAPPGPVADLVGARRRAVIEATEYELGSPTTD